MLTNRDSLNRLKAVECPDATFGNDPNPLVLAKGQGSLVWDIEGRRYIDLSAGFGSLALGHNPDEHRAIYGELANSAQPPVVQGWGDVCPAQSKVELCTYLSELLPGPRRSVGLAISGGQAVEFALKTAALYTGKTGVISFGKGYHGLDMGVLPHTRWEKFQKPFGIESQSYRVPFGAPMTELDEAFEHGATLGRDVGAVLVEPIQGRGGVIVPKPGWLEDLKTWCQAKGVLLIADEVFVGLGRAGRWSLSAALPADLVCLGKALGGGMPISACLGLEGVMQAWPKSQGEALHTGTFFGHGLSCSISLKTLQAIEQGELCARSKDMGLLFMQALRDQLVLPFSKQMPQASIRGEGLMVAFDTGVPGLGAEMMYGLRAKGLMALASGVTGECLSFSPALNISEHLLMRSVSVMAEWLAERF